MVELTTLLALVVVGLSYLLGGRKGTLGFGGGGGGGTQTVTERADPWVGQQPFLTDMFNLAQQAHGLSPQIQGPFLAQPGIAQWTALGGAQTALQPQLGPDLGALYQTMFGRDIDPSGQAFWQAQAGQLGSPDALVQAIMAAASPEDLAALQQNFPEMDPWAVLGTVQQQAAAAGQISPTSMGMDLAQQMLADGGMLGRIGELGGVQTTPFQGDFSFQPEAFQGQFGLQPNLVAPRAFEGQFDFAPTRMEPTPFQGQFDFAPSRISPTAFQFEGFQGTPFTNFATPEQVREFQQIAGGPRPEFTSTDELAAAIQGWVAPMERQLRQQHIPQIQSAAVGQGAYGGARQQLLEQGALRGFSDATTETAGRLGLEQLQHRERLEAQLYQQQVQNAMQAFLQGQDQRFADAARMDQIGLQSQMLGQQLMAQDLARQDALRQLEAARGDQIGFQQLMAQNQLGFQDAARMDALRQAELARGDQLGFQQLMQQNLLGQQDLARQDTMLQAEAARGDQMALQQLMAQNQLGQMEAARTQGMGFDQLMQQNLLGFQDQARMDQLGAQDLWDQRQRTLGAGTLDQQLAMMMPQLEQAGLQSQLAPFQAMFGLGEMQQGLQQQGINERLMAQQQQLANLWDPLQQYAQIVGGTPWGGSVQRDQMGGPSQGQQAMMGALGGGMLGAGGAYALGAPATLAGLGPWGLGGAVLGGLLGLF